MSYALEVHNLSKSFGPNNVLNEVNIKVPHKAVYGFLGNNGAGKSTLIRTVLGLLKSDKGSVKINSTPVRFGDVSFKMNIGCLVDSPCLYLQLTPLEFLGMTCRIKRLHNNHVHKILEIVNMQAHGKTPMNRFSLGMKQRIAIANALIGEPKLLILDEPTNGLDPIGMQEIRRLLKDLPNRIDATVFLSSHLLDEIQKTATHVGILHNGKIKIESSLEDLLKDQSNSLTITTNDSVGLNKALINTSHRTKIVSNEQVCILDVKPNQRATINKMVIDSGFSIFESRYSQPSLENLFLELVEPPNFQDPSLGESHD